MSTEDLPDLLYSDAERALAESLNSLLSDRFSLDKTLARTESAETYDEACGTRSRWSSAVPGCSSPNTTAGRAPPTARRLGRGGAGRGRRPGALPRQRRGGHRRAAERGLGYPAGRGSARRRARRRRHPARAARPAPPDGGRRRDRGAGGRVRDRAAQRVPGLGPGRGLPPRRRPGRGRPAARDGQRGGRRAARRRAAGPGRRRARSLYLVDVSAAGVAKAPVTSLDMTRQLCDLSFDDAPGTLIASGAAATRAVGAALTAGAAMLAAEQVGLAQRCLDMTLAYVKERHQFARPVGSFQALKHRLADVWVGVTQARAASRYAAACLAAGDPDTNVAVAVAKAYCSEVAVRAAEECVQMHGGIGFTWEHPAHLYLKRAKADSLGFGTADAHRAALASLVNLPAP